MDVTNPEQLAAIMDQLSIGALIAVIVAWAAGALVAGFTATKLAQNDRPRFALLAGAVLLAFGVMTMIQIPHQVWMWIMGVAVPLPAAYAGFRLAAPSKV